MPTPMMIAALVLIAEKRAWLEDKLSDRTADAEVTRDRVAALNGINAMADMIDCGINPLRAYYRVRKALAPVFPEFENEIAATIVIGAEVQQ